MSNSLFNMQERMLAVVPRWSGLPRLHQQSTAEHSFYVALYTDKLTWKLGWPVSTRYEALQWAVRHDMAESVTGDIMGPVKRKLIDKKSLDAFEDNIMDNMGEYYKVGRPTPQILMVVKAANIIDEYFHVCLEVAMGNSCMRAMLDAVQIRMNAIMLKVGLSHLVSGIIQEGGRMIRGIEFVQENSDVG